MGKFKLTERIISLSVADNWEMAKTDKLFSFGAHL
jgi:hypothetical protein